VTRWFRQTFRGGWLSPEKAVTGKVGTGTCSGSGKKQPLLTTLVSETETLSQRLFLTFFLLRASVYVEGSSRRFPRGLGEAALLGSATLLSCGPLDGSEPTAKLETLSSASF
jgi:hypothetical protein